MPLILDVKHELEGCYAARSVITWDALTRESDANEALRTIEELEEGYEKAIDEKDTRITKLEEKIDKFEEKIDELNTVWRERCRSILAAARRYQKNAARRAAGEPAPKKPAPRKPMPARKRTARRKR